MSLVQVGDESYEFDFASPSNREVMQIERVFDGTFKEFGVALRNGSVTALTCLVYVLEKRTNPALRFDDVEFSIGEFSVVEPEDEGDGKEEVDPEANPTVATSSPDTESVA